MAKYAFTLDGQDIVGWSSGKALPDGATEVTQADVDLYRAIKAEIKSEEDERRPQWIGSQVVKPSDTRSLYRVSTTTINHPRAGVPVIDADGISTLPIKIERMTDSTTPDVKFQAELILSLMDGEPWRCDFTNGVALKLFKTTTPSRYRIASGRGHRLIAPLVFIAAR